MSFIVNDVSSDYTVDRTIYTLYSDNIITQWNGPQLNQVNITPTATSGSPNVTILLL